MLMVLIILIIAYSIFIRKIFFKENKKDIYIREIPTKDSPAYVGKVIKGHVDGNDIVATILDLSNRGYIKIRVERNKKRKRTKSFGIEGRI